MSDRNEQAWQELALLLTAIDSHRLSNEEPASFDGALYMAAENVRRRLA